MKMTINIDNKVIANKCDILVSTTENNLYVVLSKHNRNKAIVVLNPTELTFCKKGTKVPNLTFKRVDNEELADFLILLMNFTKERSLDKAFE